MKYLEEFDSAIEQGHIEEAILALRMAPFLDIPSNSQLLTAIKDHNQETLSRHLLLSDTLNVRVPNIAKLESLFTERSELLQLVFKSRYSYESLIEKRKSEGKDIPSWTKVEFEKKELEIKNALKKNLDHLRDELYHFFKHLEETPRSEVLIH
jgi:hypothetical protein